MANKQTRQLRVLSSKTKNTITFFTSVQYNVKDKKHDVSIVPFEHGLNAFNPERAKLKSKWKAKHKAQPQHR